MIHFDKHLVSREQHFHLGFSGGVDSLAAALFLRRGNYNFTLLHIEHFDTPASLTISNKVITLANKLDLSLDVIKGKDIKDETLAKLAFELPSENNAHKIRKHIITSNGGKVVLAHSINDLAESYLQNCIKGNGEYTPLLAINGNIIRPFLRTHRKDFTCLLNQLEYADDIIPDSMPSQRQIFRETVFPAIGSDLTGTVHKLFISSGKIYQSSI